MLGWDGFEDSGTTAADATATAVLLALGCGLVALQARTVPLGAGPAGAVLGVLLPLTVPVAFLAICGVLLRRLPAGSLARVLRWTLAWGAALGIASLVAIAQQRAAGVPLTDEPSMVALFVSVGSLAGALIGAREVQGDILERRLRDENDRTEQLNHQLSVLSRILRHDLRNGLNVIYGYADVLADDTRESPERFARHIRDRAEELQAVGERARLLERLVSEEEGVCPVTTTGFTGLVDRQTEALLDRHPFVAVERELRPETYVRTVPLLDTVVENVLENAVVHNPADVPTVDVELTADGDAATLTVRDDGPGIPEREVTVLERGERPLEHSNGVGLWLVNWIVQESGGTVDVDVSDRGSVVTIRLPLVPAEEAEETANATGTSAADSVKDRRATDASKPGVSAIGPDADGIDARSAARRPAVPPRAGTEYSSGGQGTAAGGAGTDEAGVDDPTATAGADNSTATARANEEDRTGAGVAWTPTPPGERTEGTVWDDLFGEW